MRFKVVKCPVLLGGCGKPLKEIKIHGYPKSIAEPGLDKIYNERRYVCSSCGGEWIYNTLSREMMGIPSGADLRFGRNGKLIKSKSPGYLRLKKWCRNNDAVFDESTGVIKLCKDDRDG